MSGVLRGVEGGRHGTTHWGDFMQVCLMREPFEQELHEVPGTPEEQARSLGVWRPPPTHCCPGGEAPCSPRSLKRGRGCPGGEGLDQGPAGSSGAPGPSGPRWGGHRVSGLGLGLGDSALRLTGSCWSGAPGTPGMRTVGRRVSTEDCKREC